jgi:hypothetical protein
MTMQFAYKYDPIAYLDRLKKTSDATSKSPIPSTGRGNIHPDVITHVYCNTTDTSQLRRIVTDIAVWGMEIDTFEAHRFAFSQEFLADYALQQGRLNKEMQPLIVTNAKGLFVNAMELPQDKAKAEALTNELIIFKRNQDRKGPFTFSERFLSGSPSASASAATPTSISAASPTTDT